MATWYYIKNRRAQNADDFETWIESDVSPTLNIFDNAGDVRATVLIIDGTRVDDVRVYEDQVMQTVIQRWGTGGGNVPYVFPIHDSATRSTGKRKLSDGTYVFDGKGNGFGVGNDGDPMNTLTSGDRHAVGFNSTVRRLTPTECERLQGFPDGWTDEQSDSQRYRQMGNAVTVNVVEWIGKQLMEARHDN
jgi:DNA (cytosine-5)-methyltransferase 1